MSADSQENSQKRSPIVIVIASFNGGSALLSYIQGGAFLSILCILVVLVCSWGYSGFSDKFSISEKAFSYFRRYSKYILGASVVLCLALGYFAYRDYQQHILVEDFKSGNFLACIEPESSNEFDNIRTFLWRSYRDPCPALKAARLAAIMIKCGTGGCAEIRGELDRYEREISETDVEAERVTEQSFRAACFSNPDEIAYRNVNRYSRGLIKFDLHYAARLFEPMPDSSGDLYGSFKCDGYSYNIGSGNMCENLPHDVREQACDLAWMKAEHDIARAKVLRSAVGISQKEQSER